MGSVSSKLGMMSVQVCWVIGFIFLVSIELKQCGFAFPQNFFPSDSADSWITNVFSRIADFGYDAPFVGRNPEENDYVEGDMIIDVQYRNFYSLGNIWPRGIVPYVIEQQFSSAERRTILSAFKEISRKTCIRFTPRSNHKDYIRISSDSSGCFSHVGRVGGNQQVNLQRGYCTGQRGVVIHELLHSLGFLHEQNRHDRDQYVVINYRNIQAGKEENFRKVQATNSLGVEYDYNSIMHYPATAFTSNGQPTITPRRQNVQLGQRLGLSRKDIMKIRRLYKCSSRDY